MSKPAAHIRETSRQTCEIHDLEEHLRGVAKILRVISQGYSAATTGLIWRGSGMISASIVQDSSAIWT